MKVRLLTVIAALPLWATLSASVADGFPVPASDPDGVRGATVSYTRYDCNAPGDAVLNGATLERDKTWNRFIITSQASDQTYVKMPVGSSVTWNMTTYGDGVTVRYTIADKHPGGHGQKGGYALNEGELEFYVNDELAGKVVLNSYYMYHYFVQGAGDPSHEPSATASPAFAFDERHVQLNRMMKPGDRLTVKCTSGEEVGVDFIETEVVPEEISIEDAASGRNIFNVLDFGAKADTPAFDNRPAFNNAIAQANKVGGVVYIPAGTWYIGMSDEGNGANQQGIWGFSAKNVKITGAGMWHTNIQFTGWLCFGGGISAGNPTIGGTSDADNIEFCNMYLNSNLCWRNEPQAVYKAFMDIWCGGSAIHDVWMEHFECGVWLGDYNSNPIRYSDGCRIVNCRIRNNLADGVNFCQGTSNAAVINCNVRNSGDDGLAMWCNNYNGAKDETGNVFCYNTIEHIWRAGAIAIYGGTDQKAYNNWIGESYISSGFHANNTFPGHGWTATADKPVVVENNYFVKAGSYWDIFNRPYGAIDLQQSLSNIIIRNNYMWNCPAEAVSIHDGQDNVHIDGLYVNGAGISGQANDWSASNHTLGAGGFQSGLSGVTFTDFEIVSGSIPEPTVGTNLGQLKDNWPFWNAKPDFAWVESPDWADEPPYPDSKGIIPEDNPLETLSDYNLKLTGLDWITSQNKHSMYESDIVYFSVRIDNVGKNSIPEGAKFAVVVKVDDKNSVSYTVKSGIEAGNHIIVDFPSPWTATLGEHTFTATIDPAGKLLHETDRTDNVRTKYVNVKEIPEGEEPEIVIDTHSGSDMGVVKVWFENLTGEDGEFNVGDKLMPHAIVANYGSKTINLGSGQGVLWAMGSTVEYNSGMLWDDQSHTLAPGEWIDVTPCGGGNLSTNGWNNDYTYTVEEGMVTLTCRMDSPTKYNDDTASNNMLSSLYEFPVSKPVYNENPDKADKLQQPGQYWDYEDDDNTGEEVVKGFNPALTAIYWNPGTKEVEAGRILQGFNVDVTNDSDVDLPEGTALKITLYIDDKPVGTPVTYADGIAASDKVNIRFSDISYVATAGGHTVKAVITNVRYESSTSDNTRLRTFNAKGEAVVAPAPTYEYSTGFSTDQVSGLSCVITKVRIVPAGSVAHSNKLSATATYAADADAVYPGDDVVFVGTIYNNGTVATNPIKHGFLVETMPSWDPKYWSDDFNPNNSYFSVLQPGESVDLVTCGGSADNKGVMKMPSTETTYLVRFDDQNQMGLKDKANATSYNLTVTPKSDSTEQITYHPLPSGDDNPDSDLNTGIETVETAQAADDVWYTLQGIRVAKPTIPGIYIHNGKKVLVR